MLLGIFCGGCVSMQEQAQIPPDLSFLPERFQQGKVFRFYSAGGPSLLAGNWTSQFDFTGVSWNDKRTATAISRKHVVMAGHFARPMSSPLVFHDRGGRPHRRWMIGIRHFKHLGDIAIAELDSPLPESIAHYSLVKPEDVTYKRAVLVTDQTHVISVHRIGVVQGRKIQLGYDPNLDRRYWRNLVVGDSGNPAFVLERGELRLLTAFTTGGPGAGPCYGDPEVRSAITQYIQ